MREYEKTEERTKGPEKVRLAGVDQRRRYSQAIREMLGAALPPAAEAPAVNPLGLCLEIGGKLGAPGVRLLQVLGQFVAIPEAQEEEFSGVYDRMRGQTKLTAHLTLQREWLEYMSRVAHVEEPVGGGSLMTVFRMKMADGVKRVIKVLNPNAEFHMETVCDLLDKVTEQLCRRYDGDYEMAAEAVKQVREWIGRDINFTGFVARDRRFHEQNHGFKPAGFRYSIMVPRSEGPDNPYFKIEEYVEGMNLTQKRELEEAGHDLKQIVSLLVRNYFEQLMRGMVHADVHPGNFRVTGDHKVAILDRNFFIELDEKDRALVQGLMGAAGAESLAGSLAEYFSIVSPTVIHRIKAKAVELEASEIDILAKTREMLLFLKQNNCRIPLKLTLLMKNINALHGLARAAGFNGLLEAYLHQPA